MNIHVPERLKGDLAQGAVWMRERDVPPDFQLPFDVSVFIGKAKHPKPYQCTDIEWVTDLKGGGRDRRRGDVYAKLYLLPSA